MFAITVPASWWPAGPSRLALIGWLALVCGGCKESGHQRPSSASAPAPAPAASAAGPDPARLIIDDLHMLDEQQGWALAHDVLRTTNGARSFEPVALEGLPDWALLAAHDSQHAWVAYLEEDPDANSVVTVQRTTDGGRTWAAATIRRQGSDLPPESVASLTVSSARELALVIGESHGSFSTRGLLYRSADGGASWRRVAEVGDSPVSFMDATRGWMTRYDCTTCPSQLLSSDDGGKVWKRARVPVPPALDCKAQVGFSTPLNFQLPVFDGAAGLMIATCETSNQHSVVFASDNGGRTWQPSPAFDGAVVALRPPRRIWAVDETDPNPRLSASVDAGQTWQVFDIFSPDIGVPRALSFVSDTTGYLLAADGTLYKSTDAGAHWGQSS